MIGRTLTNYRVVSQLGAGGMGEVYKAVDLRLDRTVALKVLPPDKIGDPERRARFLQEARAASALNDPHIVTIHDIFTDQGTDVLVMEYVAGRTLRDVIIDGPLPVGDAIEYARQAAEGIGVAHTAGIVHRDLKPGNIMVTERGRIKVLDFGLAKLTPRAGDDQPTMSGPNSVAGTLLGTVDYMSPEQARGEPVDRRSDVFSLGCVLYEMLTGERPFQASHPLGVLHEIVFGTIRPPRDRRSEIGADVEAIVLRMLERDAARRYQSMEAVASDLRHAQRRLAEAPPSTATTFVPPIPAAPASSVFAPPSGVTAAPPPLSGTVGAPRDQRPHQAIASAAGEVAGDVAGAMATWRESMRRRKKRRRQPPSRARAFLGAWPVLLVVLFAVPVTRGWMLDQIGRLTGNSRGETEESRNAGRTSPPATPYEMTQQGLALVSRADRPGNLTAAIELLDRAIAADPGYAPAHAGIAQAYVRQADITRDKSWIARAVDAGREAVKRDAYLADAHAALAFALAEAGDGEAANTSVEQALSLEPENALAWFTRGEMAYDGDRRQDAAAAYQRALRAAPDDFRAMLGLGRVAYRSGQYGEATNWFRRATEAVPDAAIPYANLGGALLMQGDFGGAATAFQRSIEIQPTAQAYTNLGTALFSAGRYRDSVAAFDKAVQLGAADPLMWGNLGDAYRWTPGNRDRASDAYRRAVQLLDQALAKNSGNARDRSRLALYLAKLGDLSRARAELSRVSDLANRDVNTLYRAAVTHEICGDRVAALQLLTIALERGYSMRDAAADPELSSLRGDVRYQRLAARFEPGPPAVP